MEVKYNLIKEAISGKVYEKNSNIKFRVRGIVGQSEALEEVVRTALMIAPLDISILLTGETGTGKTQFAKIIHQHSSRRNKPFVELNCATLPETLIENELFGSAKGGHSGALQPVQGKVAAACSGTLFLDEIGELPLTVQAKLLQFIQSGTYYPLGSSKQEKSDIRIITASNVNLKKATLQKTFREDLYYRIKVFSIHMPALAKRKSDIHELAIYFCNESCQKHGLPKLIITPSAFNKLYKTTWKGNIRELKHAVETASIHATLKGKKEILPDHLTTETSPNNETTENISDFKSATLLFQRQFLQKKLELHNWNVSKTAKDISLSRSQLNNLIKSFHLHRYQDGEKLNLGIVELDNHSTVLSNRMI